MNAKVLVVLLAALVGGSLWLALGSDAAPPPVAATDAQAPAAAPVPVAAPLVNAQGAVGDPVAVAAAGEDGKRIAAALAPTAAGASVVVRGRAVDAAGAARAGVELRLFTWPAGDFDEDVVFDTKPKSDELRARSGDDGRFAFALTADRGGFIELLDGEFVFAAAPPNVRSGKGDQDLGDVVVVRAAVVRGRVQNEAGAPLAGAKVVTERGLLGFDEQSSSVTTADGAFALGKLRPGACTLRVALAGHLPHAAELELQAEEQRDGVVVTLRTGQAIAGRVVDDRG
ncbi:MAG: carboxypeptidase regulatory-like domain-containing protein, partial [Phycisphaerales bacterium]|nr:carboxypeptidase regulatory-like domain-containing protein [Phycisphaerales bacterium]